MKKLKLSSLKKIIPLLVLVIAAGLVTAGAIESLTHPPASQFTLGHNPDRPTLTFYTTGGATTPQLAFWHAVETGQILERCKLRVRLWKNLDDLRGTMLAGRGDLWLGHTDGFVQAARRGAPVRLLVTTGWRKFYLVYRPESLPDHKPGFQDVYNTPLAFSPPGSPAIPILRHILMHTPDRIGPDIPLQLIPQAPRLLAAGFLRRNITAALVPEPLATMLMEKVPGLAAGESLEAAYGQYTKGPARMPIAGIAVNGRTAARYPELITFITKEILASARQISHDPAKAIDSLPKAFESTVPKAIIKKSLIRDLFLVQESWKVRDEIRQYLTLAAGSGQCPEKDGGAPDDIFWR